MKKLGLSVLIMALLISCTVNHAFEEEQEVSDDEIRVAYRVGNENRVVIFKEVEVTTITEQVSATEEVEVLLIDAFSNETDQHIIFKIFPNVIGNNVLYNKFVVYKFSGGSLTVIYTNPNDAINLNVLTNNESEFTATFSGELEHWNNGAQQLNILNISSGTISIKY